MAQKLDNSELQNALALSQAACYASMSAKEHREDSDQALAMLALTQKLSGMTIAALDAAILPEIVAAPGEPTLADYVEQAKAEAATGQPVPEIMQTVAISPANVMDVPADAATAIADQSITLADPAPTTLGAVDYTPLPIPVPQLPVILPSAEVVQAQANASTDPVDLAPAL